MNKAAQALGRMGKGKAKTLTQAERKRRARRLAEARKARWPSTSNKALTVSDYPAKSGDSHTREAGE